MLACYHVLISKPTKHNTASTAEADGIVISFPGINHPMVSSGDNECQWGKFHDNPSNYCRVISVKTANVHLMVALEVKWGGQGFVLWESGRIYIEFKGNPSNS